MVSATDDAARIIRSLPARPPLDVLAGLASIGAQDDHTTAPTVALGLRGGQTISGTVIAVDPATHSVLVHTPGPGRFPEHDVVYLHAAAIDAVTVIAAHQVAPWLSDGSVAGPPSAPPSGQTRLHLRRSITARAEELASTLGRELPLTVDDATLNDPGTWDRLSTLVALTVATVTDIAGDPVGRAALDTVGQVLFAAAAGTEVSRDGDRVLVTAALRPGPDELPSATHLRAALERVL